MTQCQEAGNDELRFRAEEPEVKHSPDSLAEKLRIIDLANNQFNDKIRMKTSSDEIVERLNFSYGIIDTDELDQKEDDISKRFQLDLDISDDDEDDFDEIIHRNGKLSDRQQDPPRSPAQCDGAPLGLRLGPVGQDREEEEPEPEDWRSVTEDPESLKSKVRAMEEEQEELSGSLQALTSHYARLQMRLQQVMAAPAENREELLKDLEKFAFMGIPDYRPEQSNQSQAIEKQKKLEAETISALRGKLDELESYAYQAGEAAPPSSIILHRQMMIMEQLKERLNLDVSDLTSLSEEQLRAEVDIKLGEIVNPLRMKSQLVSQLQTQITDLEMFIHFLQEESVEAPDDPVCGCDTHEQGRLDGKRMSARDRKKGTNRGSEESRKKLQEQRENLNILKKAVSVLQMTGTVATLGCGSQKFKSNSLKSSTGKHYGDLRAKLELSVETLLDICCTSESCTKEDKPVTKDEIPTDTEFLARSPALTSVVRRELTPAIRDLMHHGLGQRRGRGGFIPFSGCMSGRPAPSGTILHAWDVVTKFYELKGGAEFNSAPARKLSRSFGLDLAPSLSNNKQVLLQTIGQIISSHSQYKRSPDQHFKAFISAGLNKRKLVPWLRLILRNQTILETMYEPWSYVVTTGFDDGFRLLERLTLYVFDLPVNLAVKQFQDMEEAF